MDEPLVRFTAEEGASPPEYRTSGSAGADLRAFLGASLSLAPGARAAVPTGLRIELPPGYEAQVRPRSGLALNSGIACLNSPGTIDMDYRGEIKVILINLGTESVTIANGDRIAQLIVAPVSRARFERACALSETQRGIGGLRFDGQLMADASTTFFPSYPRLRKGRPRFGVIAFYVSREFLFGFVVCFLFFFAVFFVNQILLMAEDILSKKAPIKDVALLLLYSMPAVVAMSFPFASLVGALMAAGRLASDNEMLAVMAAGIAPRRAFAPFLILGLVFSLLSFTMNDYFLPRGSIEFGKLSRKLVASTPALELRPWSSKRYKDVTVVTGDMVGSKIKSLLIFDRSEEGSERVISAGEASLTADETRGDVVLSLTDVWQQSVKRGETDRFEWASAANMEYHIAMRDQGSDSTVLGPRDMPSVDLSRVIAEKEGSLRARMAKRDEDLALARSSLAAAYDAEVAGDSPWPNSAERLGPALASVRSYGNAAPTDRTLQVYLLEYFKKFSIPFGALCFVVLAFPLGLLAKKSGRATGFGLGILVSVLYWALLLSGQTLGTRLSWSPFWSTWAPNAAVLAAGFALWVARMRTR